jgi:RNA recognition motif-containing protein
LFIGNLSYRATKEEIFDAAADCGVTLSEVRIITDRETGQPRGFAFAVLADNEPATIQDAIAALDGHELYRRPWRVSEARPRAKGDSRPRRPRNPSEAARGVSIADVINAEDEWYAVRNS